MGAILALLGSVFGKGITGLFNMKEKQADVMQTALGTLGTVADGDTAQMTAAAEAITAVYTSGNFLERSWRPLFMYVTIGLIIARWFGYAPPNLQPSEVDHLYNFLYIGLSGYIPLRSIDKWMLGFQVGSLLKTFISKKVL